MHFNGGERGGIDSHLQASHRKPTSRRYRLSALPNWHTQCLVAVLTTLKTPLLDVYRPKTGILPDVPLPRFQRTLLEPI